MKKILLTMLAVAMMLPAVAQYQLTNPGFDGTWNTCTPWVGKSSSTTQGTTPTGWCVANVIGTGTLGKTTVGTPDTDRTGVTNGYSCKLKNGNYGSNVIPGYVTLGTSWATAKGITGGNADGGSWGGVSFTGTPDAIQFYYKRSVASGSQSGTVVAYMWKGNTSQESVPANVVVAGNPTSVTMVNRDRNILGISTDQGGKVTKSDDFKLIASLESENGHYVSLTETPSEWTKKVCEFTYNDDTAKPEMINVIFGAMDYFAARKNHTSGNTLTVDDVTFLYYSELATATYDGSPITFSGNAATVDAEFDETKLALTSNGHGASVETSYDETTALLTVTVKGEDISVNASNYNTYTIQFNLPAVEDPATLATVTIGGINVELEDGVTSYTLPFAYNPGIAVEATASEGNTIKTDDTWGYAEVAEYDNTNKTITVTAVNSADVETPYTFSFTDAKATTSIGGAFNGSLSVTLGLEGTDYVTSLESKQISINENQDGTLNIELKNFEFSMMGMNVGDIYVPALTFNSSTGAVSGTRNVRLYSDNEGAIGLSLGHVPVAINMTISDVTNKVADASIDIITTESEIEEVSSFDKIHVDFVSFTVDETAEIEENDDYGLPLSAYKYQKLGGTVTKASTAFLQINNDLFDVPMAYIDMSGATIASDVTAEDLKQGAPADNNTIYYVPATATQLAGTNVVVGTTAQEFSLNDKVTVNIPTAFSADKVSYDRAFTAGNWSTFVSPVSVPVSAINGKVYVLSGINADAFEFTEVTGSIEANKPYLVKLDGSSIFNADAEGTVAVASETADDMTVAAGRVTQVGSYQKQQTTSDATKTWYGYTGGQFVKSNTGTINPYRTAFFVTGGSEARSFGMTTGAPTGINQTVLNVEDAPAYDLQGRRVENAMKGVYIIGGKKVILK